MSSIYGQDAFYSIYSYEYFIPTVRINDNAHSLQQSVLPRLYKNRSLNQDIKWVTENDSALVDFWETKGDTALHILTEISGIEWIETDFNISLLRYYPSVGSSNPVIIPLGGINNGSFTEAAPVGNRLKLNLLYQVAHRMLEQSDLYNSETDISGHPLMRTGIFRRDNLAMLLALTASYSLMGIDSTEDAFESKFWRSKFPGREIFKNYFRDSWILAPDITLADRLTQEPYNSRLVSVTRPPRRKNKNVRAIPAKFIEDMPLKGRLGFSVKKNESGQLAVNKIDTFRLAYACGILEGDIIRRVDGRMVRNHKQLVEYILENIDKGGSVVEISRDGISEEIVVQPIDVYYWEDDYYENDSIYYDSTFLDSIDSERDDF